MDRYLHDESGDRIGRNIQVPISERFEDAETSASADQEPVLGLDETEHPGVSVQFQRRWNLCHWWDLGDLGVTWMTKVGLG